jgi:hypothetical protein
VLYVCMYMGTLVQIDLSWMDCVKYDMRITGVSMEMTSNIREEENIVVSIRLCGIRTKEMMMMDILGLTDIDIWSTSKIPIDHSPKNTIGETCREVSKKISDNKYLNFFFCVLIKSESFGQ